ncbi:hypothetical protein [Paenibacillus albus]|uniref:Uncharacterized protein n=1 Tax=Paenibacillus albus TaxID=2495582 RepID=A0A3Q8X3P0_9BACL|nr:hypothetical protein [Paenibacillus albus]AZN38504.1 hypothetical protein EJC50_01585 [Paenibacillus albus]
MMRPYLSIVATGRNDNHGGNLIHRMQLFVDGIMEQTQKHQLHTELLLVEWNPVKDRPRLSSVLSWPKNHSFCTVRIVEVPNELHRTYVHAENLPLYQMVGKNVGIRRARGEHVLVTNIDILFSEEVFDFIAKRGLNRGNIYRVCRYDVDNALSVDYSQQEKLQFCEDHIIRINDRFGSLNTITNEYYLVFPDDARAQGLMPPFTNACGDFQLMHRDHWFDLRGYAEFDLYSMHLDSLMQYAALATGLREIEISDGGRIYHIEHEAGWSPEAEKSKQLENRLKSGKVNSLSFEQLIVFNGLMGLNQEILLFNQDDWGMGSLVLEDEFIVTAWWDKDESQGYEPAAVDYLPHLICSTEEWLDYADRNYITVLTMNAGTFPEWLGKIADIKRKIEQQKIILFGSGSGYAKFVEPVMKHFKVNNKGLYFVDNDANKVGANVKGVPIRRVEVLLDEDRDHTFIIVCSMYYSQIKRQLIQLGFEENIHFGNGLNNPYLYQLGTNVGKYSFSELRET